VSWQVCKIVDKRLKKQPLNLTLSIPPAFMKIFLVIILCAFVVPIARAQQTEDEKIVLSLITGDDGYHPCICSDDAGMAAWIAKQVNLYVDGDTLLHLSAADRTELNSKMLTAQHAIPWPGKTLENMPLVSSDTIKKILADSTKGGAYFNKKYGPTLYTFARPVFFHNDSICIVYYSESEIFGNGEDDGGYSCEIDIYVNTGGVWSKRIIVLKMIT
jgi:hypothetical protein